MQIKLVVVVDVVVVDSNRCLICSLSFLIDLISLTFSGKEFHNKAPL